MVFHFFELGIDNVISLGIFFSRLGRCFRVFGLLGVHLLSDWRGNLRQLFNLGFDSSLVVALDSGFQSNQCSLDSSLLFSSDLVTRISDHFASRVDQRITLVTGRGQLFELAIFFGVDFSIADHLLNFFLGKTGVGLDHDGLLLAGRLVFRANMQNAVCVDVEGYFDLWHATWSRWNLGQVELAQGLVLTGLLALTLQYVNGYRVLVVIGSREHLGFLGRNRSVFLDQRSHHAAHGFDTQSQRADVEQQNVFDITGQYSALDSSTHCNGFVRVDVFTCFFTEELGYQLLHQRHTGLTTDQNHVVDLASVDASIFKRHFARSDGALNQVLNQRFQLGARNFHDQVLWTGCICSDVRQVDFGLRAGRKLDLGFLGSFFQTLHGQRVTLEVHAAFFLEFVDEVVDQTNVKVFTAQERVAVGGQHFELVLAINFGNLDDRDVERTATQVINDDSVIALGLVHTVSQSGRGWFVDDALDVQTGNTAGVLGCLTLTVVEVGRNGDDRFGNRFTEVVFGGLFHFLQDFSGNLRRRHFLAIHFNPGITVVSLDDLVRDHLDVFLNDILFELTTNQTLYRIQRVVRIGNGLTLGGLPHQDLTVIGISNDRRCSTSTFCVLDNLDVTVFQNGDAGVGSPQVDTDNSAHLDSPETCKTWIWLPPVRLHRAVALKRLTFKWGPYS
ncbi:hypothetical protein ALQ15_114378 [Pseudomonas syringae pv. actinidiae]|uniref:NAD-specific glutamate dehydrogenase n=1 Tax=Pseudomonas syringae pv. actinidiae TaxID=103796 RepID=A0A7Z6UA11_PSESF|nr:hypothetical protein ALQ15_114378 [Pseudomonas syringae pv. actinidiae]